METVALFEGMKEVPMITNASEVNLPMYGNMRRIYLHSKLEVTLALAKNNKVYQQRIKNDCGEHVVVYIEVPFDKLLDLACTY